MKKLLPIYRKKKKKGGSHGETWHMFVYLLIMGFYDKLFVSLHVVRLLVQSLAVRQYVYVVSRQILTDWGPKIEETFVICDFFSLDPHQTDVRDELSYLLIMLGPMAGCHWQLTLSQIKIIQASNGVVFIFQWFNSLKFQQGNEKFKS